MTDIITIDPINAVYSRVTSTPAIEREMSEYFTFKVPGYQYTPLYKQRLWNGDKRLYNLRDHTIYTGLIQKIKAFAHARDYTIIDNVTNNKGLVFDAETVQTFIEELDLPFTPHDYQVAGLLCAAGNRRRLIVSPTGSGKSLLMYMMTQWWSNHRTLIIVPTTSLVMQLKSDFEGYSDNKVTIQPIMSGFTKEVDLPIVVSTWQSLQNVPAGWFKQFGMVIGDEAHTFDSGSLTKIMERMSTIEHRYGTTGTLEDSKVHELILQGHFGEKIELTTSRELMDRGILASLKIKAVILKYPKEDAKLIHSDYKSYQDEIKWITGNPRRQQFLVNLVKRLPGNTLVLFNFVEDHGVPLAEAVRTEAQDKKVHLIHGAIDVERRESVRKQIDADDERNHVVIASYGTYKAGVNIPKLDNIVLAHPLKAKITILQSIGRVLRLAPGKTHATLYDVADDLRHARRLNHTYKHLVERVKLYETQQFDWRSIEVKL